jgi:UDPglucose--hexose-1-phosphate uridylyltransferase
MAMHARPVGPGFGHHHFHVEFYPPNRTADKLKYLAGSELGAGAFILDARAEETAARLRDA